MNSSFRLMDSWEAEGHGASGSQSAGPFFLEVGVEGDPDAVGGDTSAASSGNSTDQDEESDTYRLFCEALAFSSNGGPRDCGENSAETQQEKSSKARVEISAELANHMDTEGGEENGQSQDRMEEDEEYDSDQLYCEVLSFSSDSSQSSLVFAGPSAGDQQAKTEVLESLGLRSGQEAAVDTDNDSQPTQASSQGNLARTERYLRMHPLPGEEEYGALQAVTPPRCNIRSASNNSTEPADVEEPEEVTAARAEEYKKLIDMFKGGYYKELCSAVLKKVDPLSQRVLLDTIRHELPPEHTEWLATRCGLWDGLGKILLIDPKLSAFVVAPRGKKVTRPGSDGRHHPLAHQFRRASWGLSDMEYLVMNCNEIADQLRDVDERRSVRTGPAGEYVYVTGAASCLDKDGEFVFYAGRMGRPCRRDLQRPVGAFGPAGGKRLSWVTPVPVPRNMKEVDREGRQPVSIAVTDREGNFVACWGFPKAELVLVANFSRTGLHLSTNTFWDPNWYPLTRCRVTVCHSVVFTLTAGRGLYFWPLNDKPKPTRYTGAPSSTDPTTCQALSAAHSHLDIFGVVGLFKNNNSHNGHLIILYRVNVVTWKSQQVATYKLSDTTFLGCSVENRTLIFERDVGELDSQLVATTFQYTGFLHGKTIYHRLAYKGTYAQLNTPEAIVLKGLTGELRE